VRVTVIIAEAQEEREFPDVPLTIANVASGLRARSDPERIAVVVRGPKSLVEALDAAEVKAGVDAAGKGLGTHLLRPTVALPEGLSVKSVTPVEVKVVLENL
jgi:hypothetical protein